LPLTHAPAQPRWHLAAAVAGWLIPGLGHLLLGQRRRGLIILGGILGLWTAGLLIGGISVIERRSEAGEFRPWFLGQMIVAPSLAVDYLHHHLRTEHQRRFGTLPEPDQEALPYIPAFGRAHELGTLYTALAGLLNLLAILHVAYHEPQERKTDDRWARAEEQARLNDDERARAATEDAAQTTT